MKIGDVFYAYSVDDNGKVELETHVLRTIRGGYAYAIHKHEFTWGKRSSKAGDYGWLDPIWPEWRTKWRINGERPDKLATTKLMAIRQAIKDHKRWSHPDDYADPTIWAKALKTLESMETRERHRKKPIKPGRKMPDEPRGIKAIDDFESGGWQPPEPE